MSLFKAYKVVRSDNKKNVLEEFASMEAAEKFMIMMQAKGEQVTVLTDDDEAEVTPDEFDIEGLEIEEPKVDFGTDMDIFNEDHGLLDTEVDDDAPDVDFD